MRLLRRRARPEGEAIAEFWRWWATSRATAARWLAAAPPADDIWSYRCVRAADPSTFESTIELDGHKLELTHIPDARLGVRRT